ncbi:dachshund homolog 2-like [Etheostoma cragini]|uniref:dachshund homolog 2-like n=1 Tax=Etheostoma cragini TaxID=417921 RepID=UPI00155F1D33|nr:dachshund homolog 2-like [Etheostoma cragini]
MPLPLLKPTNEKLPLASQPLLINYANPGLAPFLLAEGLSSMETLLTNIQGLLKGALDSARSHTEQSRLEKTELKLQLERERDARYTLQRQLSTELQATVWIQRRLKKEKKAKRKLQEELELQILHRCTVIPEKEINQQKTPAAQENKPPL